MESTLNSEDYKKLEEILSKFLYTKEEVKVQEELQKEIDLSILEEEKLLKEKEIEILESSDDEYFNEIKSINQSIQYNNTLSYIAFVSVSVILIVVLLYKTITKFI